MTEALAGAARRGVSEAGVQVRIYSPTVNWLSMNRYRLRRRHRTLACIDGSIAFIGGINMLDDLVDPNHELFTHPRL